MQKLKDILYGISLKSLIGNREAEVAGIAFDSRKMKAGCLFVAIRGLTVDGHDYIREAIEVGAKVIVCYPVKASPLYRRTILRRL